jgi:hypothetical protein
MKFPYNSADVAPSGHWQTIFSYLLNDTPASGDFRVVNIQARGICA